MTHNVTKKKEYLMDLVSNVTIYLHYIHLQKKQQRQEPYCNKRSTIIRCQKNIYIKQINSFEDKKSEVLLKIKRKNFPII